MKELIVIHGHTFGTKKALKEFCSALLKKESLAKDDEDFLIELLHRHPEEDLKVGCGIQRIYAARTEYGTRGFWIERLDGTVTDFSFMACISPPTPEHVDHRPPKTFQSLVDLFLERRGMDLRDVRVVPTQDSGTKTVLSDAHFRADWQAFHQKEAVLQITSARANLEQGTGS